MGSESLLAGSLGDPYNGYTYDDLDRLTDVVYHDSDSEAFVMDALGNRTGDQTLRDAGAVNFTVDSATNRYTAIGGNSITHDEAGNLTVDKDGYQYTVRLRESRGEDRGFVKQRECKMALTVFNYP